MSVSYMHATINTMENNNFDVVIAALPYVETAEPLMAPAVLKSVAQSVNLSCYTFDFNAEIIDYINVAFPSIQDKIARWFLYDENQQCTETQSAIDLLVEYTKTRILEKNPKWVCLSLFCHTAKKFNNKLCKSFKQTHPEKIIVIGGNAVFSTAKSKRPYAEILKKAKLIDHYVVGDGENPLYNLFTGSNLGADIESFQVLENLNGRPHPIYDDYNWDLYRIKRLPIYGSRGCVRKCTFCDVYKLWEKFKFRTAEDIFEEMVAQAEKTGIRDFYFKDSLINGSISEYRKLIRLLANYNESAQEKIKWTSFFIFRPQAQMTEEDWDLTARSGGYRLMVGVESFVESIRNHMRKKFSNEDIDYSLSMARKYNIKLTLLVIIGYVNETEADFLESLKWLEDHAEYAKDAIDDLSIGGTLILTDLSDLYLNADEYKITVGNKIHLWTNKSIGLDYEVREERKRIFSQKALELGYRVNAHEKPVA